MDEPVQCGSNRFLKCFFWGDTLLIHFCARKSKIYHSTFFFLLMHVLHPCVMSFTTIQYVDVRYLTSWSNGIWQSFALEGDLVKDVLVPVLPLVAHNSRRGASTASGLSADKILSKMAEHGAAHGRRQIRSFRAKPRRLCRLALPPASEYLLSRSIPFKFNNISRADHSVGN